jgi:hypothetical protein
MATLVAITSYAQERAHLFGLKAGLNLSRFHSDNRESDVKPGLNVGFYLRAPVGRNTYLRPELYYSNQGEREDIATNALGTSTRHTTNLNYLNLPVLFEAGKRVTVQGGPQLSYLLSAYDRTVLADKTTKRSIRSSLNSFDLAGVIGIGINPHKCFNAGMRLNYGLTDIFAEGSSQSIHNHVFHVYVGYTF